MSNFLHVTCILEFNFKSIFKYQQITIMYNITNHQGAIGDIRNCQISVWYYEKLK